MMLGDYFKYIPVDKSWVIRMSLLDLVNEKPERAIRILESQKDLGDDLISLTKAIKDWNNSDEIYVGESGTLYRFLKYISWSTGADKNFIKTKTLVDRDICDDESIVNLSQEELLKIDNGTSQWASAKVICGDTDRLENAPYKLQVTYDAMDSWKKNEDWEVRKDITITNQVEAFISLLNTGKLNFELTQSEDYCFARAFGLIDGEVGERRWPSLLGHETNRIEEMEVMLGKYRSGDVVDSNDHRVVQSIAMLAKHEGKEVKFTNSGCVAKSWPLFWEFLDNI